VLAHFLKIRFKLVMNVDNERGCYRGEQTDLFPRGDWHHVRGRCGEENTHEDQPGIHFFVISSWSHGRIIGFALELVAELDAGGAGHSKDFVKRLAPSLE